MIRRMRSVAFLVAVFAICQWLAPSAITPLSVARAAVPGVTCNANMTSITFGNVDEGYYQSNYNLQTTGYLTYYCTNTNPTAQTITACFSIGNPGGAAQRSMSDTAGDQLDYQLYQDASGTTTWGSRTASTWGNPYKTDITVPANGASTPSTVAVYAVISNDQSYNLFNIIHLGLPAGNYSVNYGNGDMALDLASGANAPCSSASGGGNSLTFSIIANIKETCQVTTNPLTFPPTSAPSGILGQTTVTVACNGNHTGYQVGLDNGKNYDGSNRRMRGGPTNSDYISYGLYQNSNDTTSWGNTTGSNTETGTKNPQTFNVYGKVNTGQGAPPAGTYFDAVTVYVYY